MLCPFCHTQNSDDVFKCVTCGLYIHPPHPAPAHIEAANPVIIATIWITGIVGFSCVLGGIFAIYRNAVSPSEVELFGSKLTTGHVGVAFVFIGVVVFGAVVRKAFRTIVELGRI